MIYPWQHTLWTRVAAQIKNGRLGHALLCKGPEGLGKLTFARHVAQTLLCETQQLCGHCRACELNQAGSHPDFFSVTLEDKAKSIKVEQIRHLSEQLSLSAHYNGYQVALLYPAERMNQASANALLKTLEEPSGAVVIILIADQLAGIAQTILSRCHTLSFSVPASAQVLPWLTQALQRSEQEVNVLLQWAQGSPLRALRLGEQAFIEVRNLVLQKLWELLNHDVVVSVVALRLSKENMQAVMSVIFSIALDVLRLHFVGTQSALQNQDCATQLLKIKTQLSQSLLAQYVSQLSRDKHLAQHAAGINVQLLLERVLLDWQNLRGE